MSVFDFRWWWMWVTTLAISPSHKFPYIGKSNEVSLQPHNFLLSIKTIRVWSSSPPSVSSLLNPTRSCVKTIIFLTLIRPHKIQRKTANFLFEFLENFYDNCVWSISNQNMQIAPSWHGRNAILRIFCFW